jgi:signal transduction histidine kinase
MSWLNAARRRLAETLREEGRRKEQFLAVLAHELRNPLGSAANALYVLRTAAPKSRTAASALDLLGRQLGQMNRLVEDLLDVSRAGRGTLRLERKSIEAGALVENAVASARPLLDARRHRLEVVMPSQPVWLHADPARLEQALVNLLSNAARYTPPGGLVRVTAECRGSEFRLGVRDNGSGLAPGTRVFELFAQAETGSHGGLGIGLYLVRSLIRLHGGDVTVASDGPGKGCEFVVRLPLSDPVAGPARCSTPEPQLLSREV